MILTNPLSNQEADTIFREYQEQSDSGQLKFRRWPLRAVCGVLSYVTLADVETIFQHKCRVNMLRMK